MFQNQPFIDPLQNRCSWIIHKIHRKTPVLEPSLIKFQVLCTASLLKRDSNTSFFLWILTVIQEHLWTADSETPARLFKNTFFYRTFPVTDSHIFRFPACNFIKKETPYRCFSVNFTKFLRTYFDRTSLDDCFLCLSVNFEKYNLLDFTSAFQAFYTRSSYSKAFIYLKFLEIICKEVNLYWNCKMSTCKLTKKTHSHILLHAFYLNFFRIHHNYFFWRGFENVQA